MLPGAEFRAETAVLGTTKGALVSRVRESSFLLSWTLSTLMVKVYLQVPGKPGWMVMKKPVYLHSTGQRLGEPEMSPVDRRVR